MRSLLLGVLAATACTPTLGEPVWALDPIYVEPTADGIYGLQSWELFDERWADSYAARYYVCGVVVALEGTPVTPPEGCQGCEAAWEVTTRFVESDCEATVAADPAFLDIRGIGVGAPPADAPLEDPHPGASRGAWADYGDGYDSYGWAYAEALDHGGTDATWDAAPWSFVPVWVWQL